MGLIRHERLSQWCHLVPNEGLNPTQRRCSTQLARVTQHFNRVRAQALNFQLASKMARAWSTVIGLEIHAQLLTSSKLFSR
jgi:hypothetical protein